jgi:hypothetical protein
MTRSAVSVATGRRTRRLIGAAILAALTTAGMAVITAPAHAATGDTWSGAGDGESWGDANNWSGKAVPLNGDSVTIAPTATEIRPSVSGVPSGTQLASLTLTDSSLSGGDVTVTGDFTWTVSQVRNTLGVPLTVEGDATLSGAGERDSTQPVVFDGNTDISGPGLLSIQDKGPAVTNAGAMTVSPGTVIRATVCCATSDEFLNTGRLSVPSSAGITTSFEFMNFVNRGPLSVGSGSELEVSSGPGELGAHTLINGGGTVLFDLGAAITLASGISIGGGSTVGLTGNAEFFGPGSFTGAGKFAWSGGTIDGSLDVARTVGTTISGSAAKNLTSPVKTPAILTLRGATTVQGTGELELFANGTLDNLGTLTMGAGTTIGASVCCAAPNRFTNGGTLRVSAGKGTATVTNMAFSNTGTVKIVSGTLSVQVLSYKQTAGDTQLAGGALSAVQPIDIAGGTLSGSGKITGSVLSSGTVAPATTGGVLKISGAYHQTGKGVLKSVITGTKPGSKFGQLVVGGKATLAGTVWAQTAHGFRPRRGQAFAILLCHSRSGRFTHKRGTPAFSVQYRSGSVRVKY